MNKDRVVVIAGAGGGLGRVCTRVFGEAGARLALLGRDADKLDAMAQEEGLDEGRYLSLVVDVSQQSANEAAASQIVERFGSLAVLVNLIGGWAGGKTLFETADSDFESMLQQHVSNTVSMAKAYVPAMVDSGWGRVLAISSPSAGRPPGKNAAYAAAKAGQEALMLSLAQELKGTGVTANMLQVNTIDVEGQRIKNPSEKNASWSSPEEISATLLHLCSDEAGMINGARIPVFGGF